MWPLNSPNCFLSLPIYSLCLDQRGPITHLAVKLHDHAEHAVGGRVLRAKVDDAVLDLGLHGPVGDVVPRRHLDALDRVLGALRHEQRLVQLTQVVEVRVPLGSTATLAKMETWE